MRVGIFNTAFVGDLVLMSRLVDALSMAGHEIILFSNGAGCQLYKADSRIKKLVTVKKQKGLAKISAAFGIAKQINDECPEALILAHRSLTSAFIAILSRQRKIVTFSDTALSGLFFRTVRVSPQIHESERYLALAEEFAGEHFRSASKMSVTGDVTLKTFLSSYPDFQQQCGKNFFVCAPGSVWQTKRYPPKLLAEVLYGLLSAKPDLNCVLSGGPADFDVLTEVISAFGRLDVTGVAGKRLIDARKCLPLNELIELVRGSRFVLTPDSAPLHIAGATGTKVFAFFGPTPSDTGFGPLSANSEILNYRMILNQRLDCQPCSTHGQNICPLGHHSCLADLPPQRVVKHMLSSLD
ncbi:MAG: glycosyltransferase family 9 protein [Proteobacteria bacterium]|nr:glycosyltransferase family 9 protein [Pseudomonadota bacterium]